MNADLPRNVSGLYPPEHADATSFAWTAAQVKVALPGADRRMPWECSLRFRGGRSTLDLQPTVDMAVDGITRGRQAATNDYEVLAITAPPSVRQGLTLIITSSNTVVPGPSDRRELGVQVDRLECRPQGRGLVWPPAVAIADAAGLRRRARRRARRDRSCDGSSSSGVRAGCDNAVAATGHRSRSRTPAIGARACGWRSG